MEFVVIRVTISRTNINCAIKSKSNFTIVVHSEWWNIRRNEKPSKKTENKTGVMNMIFCTEARFFLMQVSPQCIRL